MGINYDKSQKEHEARRSLLQTSRINEHPEGTAVALNILGHPEALVSDQIRVDDFYPNEDALSLLDAKRGDFLHELAARIEKDGEYEV